MEDEHFSHEVIARFFRSELSRVETRDFVRHLLRRCPRCLRFLWEATRRQDFRLLVGAVEGAAARYEPEVHRRILERILYLAEQKAARPVRGSTRGRA